jgi:hypothetical protein
MRPRLAHWHSRGGLCQEEARQQTGSSCPLAVPAWANGCGQRGAVLLLPRGGGLACCVFVRRGPGAGQVLAANPDGGERGQQGE